MYYLECINTVVDLGKEERYTNYNNYFLLTSLERKTVFSMVSMFNPKIMTELNIFKIEPDFVPIGKENEFFDINNKIFEEKIKSEVKIEAFNVKVLKAMVCKQSWIDKYYEEPMKEYEDYEKKIEAEEKNIYKRIYKNGCTCCACTCDCCCQCDCDACCEEN